MLKDAADYTNRNAKRKARRAMLLQLLGGKCVSCGSRKDLHFDHINKKDKTLDIANSIDTKEHILLDEIKKCQLLCKDCHLVKSKANWDWGVGKPEHGTIWMYKKYKCRCEPCKDSMSDYYYQRKTDRANLSNLADLYIGLLKVS